MIAPEGILIIIGLVLILSFGGALTWSESIGYWKSYLLSVVTSGGAIFLFIVFVAGLELLFGDNEHVLRKSCTCEVAKRYELIRQHEARIDSLNQLNQNLK